MGYPEYGAPTPAEPAQPLWAPVNPVKAHAAYCASLALSGKQDTASAYAWKELAETAERFLRERSR